MLGVHVIPIRQKKYIFCFAGHKRGQKLYDVLSPMGTQIGTRLYYEDAITLANIHYIQNENLPKRNSIPKNTKAKNKKVKFEKSRLEYRFPMENFSDLDNASLVSKGIERYLLEDYPRAKINPW